MALVPKKVFSALILRFFQQKVRKPWRWEKLENMMNEGFFEKKTFFHLFKSLLYKNGKAQNMPLVAGRFVNFLFDFPFGPDWSLVGLPVHLSEPFYPFLQLFPWFSMILRLVITFSRTIDRYDFAANAQGVVVKTPLPQAFALFIACNFFVQLTLFIILNPMNTRNKIISRTNGASSWQDIWISIKLIYYYSATNSNSFWDFSYNRFSWYAQTILEITFNDEVVNILRSHLGGEDPPVLLNLVIRLPENGHAGGEDDDVEQDIFQIEDTPDESLKLPKVSTQFQERTTAHAPQRDLDLHKKTHMRRIRY